MPLVCMVGLSGCASQGALDNVSNDIDAVKTRMFSVEKDLAGLREESKLSVSSVEKGFKSDVAAVRKMSADIQATIDSTKSEMQALNGKLDDTALAVKKPAEDLARYREDADKRIIALEERLQKQQALLDNLSKQMAEMAKAKKDEAASDRRIWPDTARMPTSASSLWKSGSRSSRHFLITFQNKWPKWPRQKRMRRH